MKFKAASLVRLYPRAIVWGNRDYDFDLLTAGAIWTLQVYQLAPWFEPVRDRTLPIEHSVLFPSNRKDDDTR